DFFGEVVQSMAAVESAMVVVDGVSGIQVGTDAAWRQANTDGLPRMVFVNKLERENADFHQVFGQLRERHGTGVLALTIPIGSAMQVRGIRSLLDAIVDFAPAAAEAHSRAEEGNGTDGIAALVFKTVSDPFIGRLSFLRAFSGDVHSDHHLWNAQKRKEERIG